MNLQIRQSSEWRREDGSDAVYSDALCTLLSHRQVILEFRLSKITPDHFLGDSSRTLSLHLQTPLQQSICYQVISDVEDMLCAYITCLY